MLWLELGIPRFQEVIRWKQVTLNFQTQVSANGFEGASGDLPPSKLNLRLLGGSAQAQFKRRPNSPEGLTWLNGLTHGGRQSLKDMPQPGIPRLCANVSTPPANLRPRSGAAPAVHWY